MVTRDVFQVLKLHSPAARAILRTFKTSLVPIYHVMHSRSYDFLYLLLLFLLLLLLLLSLSLIMLCDGKICTIEINYKK